MSRENHPAPQSANWHQALSDLAFDCADLPATEEAGLVRALHELLAKAPWQHSLAGVNLPDGAAFEALVTLGAGESAVLALVGEDTGYMLSRGAGGLYLASVILPGRSAETSSSGETFALALASALALALVDTAAVRSEAGDPDSRPALRLN